MKRILLIEDDVPQRSLFKTTLENSGYHVVEASDGQEGLRLYQHQPWRSESLPTFLCRKKMASERFLT
jgi:CheY-like chemotaxis protein